jgi:hypothetical protein
MNLLQQLEKLFLTGYSIGVADCTLSALKHGVQGAYTISDTRKTQATREFLCREIAKIEDAIIAEFTKPPTLCLN